MMNADMDGKVFILFCVFFYFLYGFALLSNGKSKQSLEGLGGDGTRL